MWRLRTDLVSKHQILTKVEKFASLTIKFHDFFQNASWFSSIPRPAPESSRIGGRQPFISGFFTSFFWLIWRERSSIINRNRWNSTWARVQTTESVSSVHPDVKTPPKNTNRLERTENNHKSFRAIAFPTTCSTLWFDSTFSASVLRHFQRLGLSSWSHAHFMSFASWLWHDAKVPSSNSTTDVKSEDDIRDIQPSKGSPWKWRTLFTHFSFAVADINSFWWYADVKTVFRVLLCGFYLYSY